MDNKSLKKVSSILMKHKGKNNAITSNEISALLGINEDDTHSITRYLIRQSIIEYNLPVVACSKGYYAITSAEDIKEYEEHLLSRIKGIADRLAVVRSCYELNK